MTRISNSHFNTHTMYMSSNNEKQYSLRKEVSSLALRFFKYMCNNPFALITTTLACVARTIEARPILGPGISRGSHPNRWVPPRPDPSSISSPNPIYNSAHFEIVHQFDNQYLCSWFSPTEPEFVQDMLRSNCYKSWQLQENMETSPTSTTFEALLLHPYPFLNPQFDNLHMCSLVEQENLEFVRDILKVNCDEFRQSQQNLVEPFTTLTTSADKKTISEDGISKLWDEICPRNFLKDINPYRYFKTCMKNICVFPPVVLERYKVIIGDWCKDENPMKLEAIFSYFNRYIHIKTPTTILTITPTTVSTTTVSESQSGPDPTFLIGFISAVAGAVGAVLSLVTSAITLVVAKAAQGAAAVVGTILPRSLLDGMQLITQGSMEATRAIIGSVENIAAVVGTPSLSDAVQATGDEIVSAIDEISLYFEADEGEILSDSGVPTALESQEDTASDFVEDFDKSWKDLVCLFIDKNQKCRHVDSVQNSPEFRTHKGWWNVNCLSMNDQKWCKYTADNTTNVASTEFLLHNALIKVKDKICQFIISDLWCNLLALSNTTNNSTHKIFDVNSLDHTSDDIKGITIEHSLLDGNSNWKISMFH